ncbi:HlyD family secretion protein [Massilia sp. YIM B02763]|uniref:HlyD family secretion protein n=1 Tax=Massilia sp. YIM B02763 TaxID=3050130 RepID=UPI0025B7249F|nr:HlyD family secretion protein [Massilia sp. YIM B02763]MDN4055622.1 HlyD family secretion protein [Massilia sp. YIM B02763]
MTTAAPQDIAVGAAPRKPTRKHIKAAAGGAIAAVALAAYGVHWWTEGRFIEKTDDAYVGADTVVLRPKVPGYIAEEHVADNQAVKKGELLYRIDDRDYRAAVAKAEAAVAAQQALLDNLAATRRQQRAVVQQTEAGVAASAAELARARDDDARYRSLAGKAAVSLQSAQRAEAAWKEAQANGAKARATQLAAERELDVIASRAAQATAALDQARAELELARLNLAYTEVRAPADGVVGNRRARAGAYAQAGEHLVSLIPARGLWIDANFKEDQLARLHPGQRAEIEADALPGKVFHGRVQSLAPATGAQFSVLPPENATGNFTKIVQRVPVRIVLDEADGALGRLRPGLSVTATVDSRDGRQP